MRSEPARSEPARSDPRPRLDEWRPGEEFRVPTHVYQNPYGPVVFLCVPVATPVREDLTPGRWTLVQIVGESWHGPGHLPHGTRLHVNTERLMRITSNRIARKAEARYQWRFVR